jgi:Carbohydrate binding domain
MPSKLSPLAECRSRIAACVPSIRNPKSEIRNRRVARTGSVYLAVMGTSLIVALLALSALALQRIQNRMLSTTADIRQAQLNAEAAIELGLLAMKQNTSWRTTYTSGHWIVNRGLSVGTCSLDGTDPVDSDLTNNTTDPVVLVGIGNCGTAEQRVQFTIDPQVPPLSCLRSGIAAGHAVTLTNSVLRSTGQVSANSVSASSSTIYGNVQAVSTTGTISGTSTSIASSQLPTMPTWTTVFDYYKTNGTQLDPTKLLTSTPNIATNTGVESPIGSSDWTGTPPGVSTAVVAQSNTTRHGGTYSLKVSSRADYTAGAAQRIDTYVKPAIPYVVNYWVYSPSGQNIAVSLWTKGTGGSAQSASNGTGTFLSAGTWTNLTATLAAPSWSGNLEYAFVKIAGGTSLSTTTFYVDDLIIRENVSGKFIYQQVLGPGVNTLYTSAPTNSQGLYWIDLQNSSTNRLTIERSRIRGTLLVLNPPSGSCIGGGPINWSPAVAGYPALLVHADTAANANFTIGATNRTLSETENVVNFNPTGAPSDDFGQDTNTTEIYPSEIRGLVAVENNLTFQGNALVRGAVMVGNDLVSTAGSLEVNYQPDSLLNPPPGFSSPSAYVRRAASAKKVVLP